METNIVYNEDCIQGLKRLPDKSVDLILTDPPYGIGINKMNFVTSGAIKVGGAYRNDYSNHNTEWDENPLTKEVFDEIVRVSRNQIIFGANNFSNILPPSRCWIVWDKRCKEKYNNDFADCEIAWTSFDKPARIIRYLWSGMIQSEMGLHKEKRYHPTQKPLEVMRRLIKMFSEKNQIILDPFAGSGSTLVACKELNRRWVGFEISPEYCKIIKKRLSQETMLGFFETQNTSVLPRHKVEET